MSPGPPPLAPFGLVLHHDGRFSHEGEPVLNDRLRAAFERGVVYLPEEKKYVVTLRHFRGELIVEECGFFVRLFEPETGRIRLSDESEEPLDIGSLRCSPIDGALICSVKRDLCPGGLPARFLHAAQSELMNAVVEDSDPPALGLAGQRVVLPEL